MLLLLFLDFFGLSQIFQNISPLDKPEATQKAPSSRSLSPMTNRVHNEDDDGLMELTKISCINKLIALLLEALPSFAPDDSDDGDNGELADGDDDDTCDSLL